MSSTTADKAAPDSSKSDKKARKGKGRLLILLLGLILVLGGGAAGAWFFVPAFQEAVRKMIPGLAPPAEGMAEAGPAEPPPRPSFVEFPEMTVSLPNGGRPRQLRLKLAIEIMGDPGAAQTDLLSPRIYDSLVLYLRTLRDSELEGALSMDRLRGDLHRRLELMLGAGKVRDVLITSFVVA